MPFGFRRTTKKAFVRKGQLFQIDPRVLPPRSLRRRASSHKVEVQLAQAKAQLTQAQAQLAQSVANQERTQLDVDKYTPLEKQHAVTRQELDNAVKNNLAAKCAGRRVSKLPSKRPRRD